MVRALLIYVGKGYSELLRKINKYQKVFQYGPDKFRSLLSLLRNSSANLQTVRSHTRRRSLNQNIYQVLSKHSSSEYRLRPESTVNFVIFSAASRTGTNRSSKRISKSCVTCSMAPSRDQRMRAIDICSRICGRSSAGAGRREPEGILVLIKQWRRDAWSRFFFRVSSTPSKD